VNGKVTVQANNQKVTEGARRLQIPHMPNVQQIKTSVRGYNILSGRPQVLAATAKVLKLDDFLAHASSLIFMLCVDRIWPLN
jgi:hypothetical protein